MPQLIKKIEGEVFSFTVGDVIFNNQLIAQVQQEDYVNLNGFIAYLQNLSKANDTYLLTKPNNFGLKNNFNLDVKNLEIDY
jgi:hypothetical protein